MPGDLARYGEVIESKPPKVKLRVERASCPRCSAAILARHTIEDVSVEDPPLEEVIAEMFSTAGEATTDEQAIDQAANG